MLFLSSSFCTWYWHLLLDYFFVVTTGMDTTKFNVTFGPGSMGLGVETPDGLKMGSIVTEVLDGGKANEGNVKIGDILIAIALRSINNL